MNGAGDFDFTIGTFDVLNRYRGADGEWTVFAAVQNSVKHGNVLIERIEWTRADGDATKGVGIQTYDPATDMWQVLWLSNRESPDFRPMHGGFTEGLGTFLRHDEDVSIRWRWSDISETGARWDQALSHDGGETWDVNLVQELTRRA